MGDLFGNKFSIAIRDIDENIKYEEIEECYQKLNG
jgi:tRNA(Glu) U13 pseudouridine synthase TruD